MRGVELTVPAPLRAELGPVRGFRLTTDAGEELSALLGHEDISDRRPSGLHLRGGQDFRWRRSNARCSATARMRSATAGTAIARSSRSARSGA